MIRRGASRLSTTWDHSAGVGVDFADVGQVVLGSSLHFAGFNFDGEQGRTSTTIVGGGWGNFKAIGSSNWESPDLRSGRIHLYGLRNEAVLFRWEARMRNGESESIYQPLGSYPGFSSVKGMTLISKTATYDTFLVNLRGGSLYTIESNGNRVLAVRPNLSIEVPVRVKGVVYLSHETGTAIGSTRFVAFAGLR